MPRRLLAATTIMGLQIELQKAADELKEQRPAGISIASGCELFMRFVTRTALDYSEYETCKERILERGEFFRDHSTRARTKIATLGAPFLRDGHTIITIGFSRVVLHLLLHVATKEKRLFEVIVAESKEDGPGMQLARRLADASIPVTVIEESAVAVAMERADMVLAGAEGVVENGGVINKVRSAATLPPSAPVTSTPWPRLSRRLARTRLRLWHMPRGSHSTLRWRA